MRYALAFCLAVSVTVAAQQPAESPRALTAADYSRAERFMTYNTTPLVLRSGVRPPGCRDDRFWYRVTTEKRQRRGADRRRARDAVGVRPAAVPRAHRRGWTRRPRRRRPQLDAPSPDGKRTAFIRDWNLWVRDVATGKETR